MYYVKCMMGQIKTFLLLLLLNICSTMFEHRQCLLGTHRLLSKIYMQENIVYDDKQENTMTSKNYSIH